MTNLKVNLEEQWYYFLELFLCQTINKFAGLQVIKDENIWNLIIQRMLLNFFYLTIHKLFRKNNLFNISKRIFFK